MEPAKLRQHLIVPDNRLFAVLDGARVPDLPRRLFDHDVPNYCLLEGDIDPDMAYIAPYLAYLAPEEKFTDWVFAEGAGKKWGIFVRSRASVIELRRHFRGLVNVITEDGQPLKFRYYDPYVLRTFLPTCNAGELATFFGRSDAIFAEGDTGEKLFRFELDNGALKTTELN